MSMDWKSSVKKVFLKLSLENTYAGVSFSYDPKAGAFQLILQKF